MKRLMRSSGWQRAKVAISVLVWVAIGLSVISLI